MPIYYNYEFMINTVCAVQGYYARLEMEIYLHSGLG